MTQRSNPKYHPLKKVTIASQEIQPGEFKEININIARLPSHTLIDRHTDLCIAFITGWTRARIDSRHAR
jgi:hypothetical protein